MKRAALTGLVLRLSARIQPTPQRPFHACSSNFGNKQKAKVKNSLTAESLFPVDCDAHLDSSSFAAQNSAVSSASDGSIADEDDGDIFGSLATPEIRESLKKLEGLWPMTGWNDDVEDDDHDVAETSHTQSPTFLPVAYEKKEDELSKPSLLYPGKTFEKALSKGPRTSFQIQDGEERRNASWYQSKIHKFVDQGLVREALQLFETGMKLEDQIEPNDITYRKLIQGCCKIGEVDKSLVFYLRMRERGDPILPQTAIHVFGACLRCDDREKAVRVADQVWSLIKADDFHFSGTQQVKGWRSKVYTAYLKVLSSGQGLERRVFDLYEEMLTKNITPDGHTLGALLSTCSEDVENGFAKALLLWKNFRSRYPKFEPDTFCYELLVKTIIHSGVAKPNLFVPLLIPQRHDNPLIAESLGYLEELKLPKTTERFLRLGIEKRASVLDRLKAGGETASFLLENDRSSTVNDELDEEIAPLSPSSESLTISSSDSPSSSSPSPVSPPESSVYKSSSSTTKSTPHDRLSLFGGPQKFVDRMMASERSRPETSTFILLLRCYPKGSDAPKEVLSLMDRTGVRPDEEWISAAIKHEVINGAREDMSRVWRWMEVAKMRGITLTPKVFASIAVDLRTKADFKTFLKTMDEFDVEPSSKTFEDMILSPYGKDVWRLRTMVFKVWTGKFMMRPSRKFRKDIEKFLADMIRLQPKSDKVVLFLPVYEAWLSKNNLKWGEYES